MKRILSCILCFTILCGCSSTSSSTSAETSGKLVLACWQATPQVVSLVEMYNSAYPEHPIIIKEYNNPDIDVDEALRQMDAALVAGDKADLYCFGSLDLQRLINGGLIADLTPFVEADSDFDDKNYYMDILDMFRQNGKLYEMPCFFQLAGICLPDGVVPDEMTGWTVQEYIDFDTALKAKNQTVLSMAPESMLAFMVQYSIDAFISENRSSCNFENEDFYELLNFVKDYANGNGGDSVGMDTWVMGIFSYVNDIKELGTQPQYVGYPDAERNGPCVMSLVSYGISSTTEYPDECWNFIKITLSDKAYLNAGIQEGFPLSKSALNEGIRAFSLSTGDEGSPLHGLTDMNGNYYIPLEEKYVPYIYELLDSVTHARFRYSGVFSIIREEGEAFLENDKTTEETARLIQNRVSIYLAEQQ